MNKIEDLMSRFPDIKFEFEPMPGKLCGLNIGDQITINECLSYEEQYQWLTEELGHYYTSVGDISDYSVADNQKQEYRARKWGYQYLLNEGDIEKLLTKYHETDYEIAEDLGIQVPFLHEIGFSYGLDYKHAFDY